MFERPLDLKKVAIAFAAAALVVVGLGIIVYVSVARNRLASGPTPTAATAAPSTPNPTPAPLTPTHSEAEVDFAAGIVTDYSAGALIIVIQPTEGDVEQIIVPENLEVVWASGHRASPMDISPGQSIYAEGQLDSLDRLVADLIIIMEEGSGPIPSPTVASKTTDEAAAEIPEQAWRGQYYANSTLSGEPVLVRRDSDIDFQWEHLAPGPNVPADRFSVRWEGLWRFGGGLYSFIAYTDDGVRVWVDDRLVIDRWRDQPATLFSTDVHVQAGQHLVRVEYYEGTGHAEARVFWEQQLSSHAWQAEYYDNSNLEGTPVLERRDSEITFNWGLGSPAEGVPADEFSARWMQTSSYEEGPYRFKVRADDGVRLWVDDVLIIDEWHASQQATYVGYAWLSAESHEIRIEYYEGVGNAYIQLWKERITAFTGWKGSYYDNPELAEPPQFMRDDQTISFDWRQGSPGFGIPNDNFSVRWVRHIDFEDGYYNFWAIADDGVQLYIDDHRIIDAWHDSTAERQDAGITIREGRHKITVEYYERGGQASIQVGWERSSTATPTPTLAPTLTPSPTPSRTATPTRTPTQMATATSAPTETPPPPTQTPTSSPTATATVAVPTDTVTPTATSTEEVTATVAVTETVTTTSKTQR